MRRTWWIGVVSLAAIVILSVPVSGSSVHLKGGSHAEPAFTDNGLTLTGAGELAGLGNGDVLVTLAAIANPTGTCGNPGTNTWQAGPESRTGASHWERSNPGQRDQERQHTVHRHDERAREPDPCGARL